MEDTDKAECKMLLEEACPAPAAVPVLGPGPLEEPACVRSFIRWVILTGRIEGGKTFLDIEALSKDDLLFTMYWAERRS